MLGSKFSQVPQQPARKRPPRPSWLIKDLELALRSWYPEGGVLLVQYKGVKLDTSQILLAADYLGLEAPVDPVNPYLEKLDRDIGQLYSHGGISLVHSQNDNLSLDFIEQRVLLLKFSPFSSLKEELPEVTLPSAPKAKNVPVKRPIWLDTRYDGITKRYYPLGGSDSCIYQGVDLTPSQIGAAARFLGVASKRIPSEKKLEALIHKYYPEGGASEVIIYFSSFITLERVEAMARDLGYPKVLSKKERAFQRENDLFLKYYPLGGYTLCRVMGTSLTYIQALSRASKLGLKLQHFKSLSPDEEAVVRELYPKVGVEGIYRAGHLFPITAIRKCITRMQPKKLPACAEGVDLTQFATLYSVGGSKAVRTYMQHWTKNEITQIINYLGISRKRAN